jgi:hypothetical protein
MANFFNIFNVKKEQTKNANNTDQNDDLVNFHDHPFAAHLGIDKTYKKS